MNTLSFSQPKWSRTFPPYFQLLSSFTNISRDGFYGSLSNNNNETERIQEPTAKKRSARSDFLSLPVHSSILNSIEDMGVGLRPMHAKSRYMKMSRRKLRAGQVINETDERNILKDRNAALKKTSETEPISNSPHMWMPLLPFGGILPTHLSSHKDLVQQIQLKKLPIKVLGSAGSRNDELPRSTKGLPEIAIAGRSNVGKSTLLNALLYGNQFSSDVPGPRKFIRGKTPEGAKLPKGPKATVSDMPGETKRITFYQVSTQISYVDSTTHQSKHITNSDTCTKAKSHEKKHPSDISLHSEVKEKEKVSLVLIDLPGYGFAYTSDERIHEWKDLMHHFLIERGHMLKRILLLIDARHGFKKADFDFLDTLQQSLRLPSRSNDGRTDGESKSLPPVQVVLTKCDLVKQKDLARRVVQVKRQLSESLIRESKGNLPIMLVSAKAGLGYNNIRGSRARGGILELQQELASIALRPKLMLKLIKTRKPIESLDHKQLKRR